MIDPGCARRTPASGKGLTPDEIELRWPGWLEAHRRPPTFEPYADVVARADEALGEIAAEGSHQPVAPRRSWSPTPASCARSIRHLGGDDGRGFRTSAGLAHGVSHR